MKTKIENGCYDIQLEASDWRYTAAIVGLYKYLQYHRLDYEVEEAYLRFHEDDITKERYLKFVEYTYKAEMYHTRIEDLLSQTDYQEAQLKFINDLLKGNSVMKKIFGKVKFDGKNKVNILETLRENRETLIMETFRNKANMYANYANTGQLLEEGKACCRLLGYYVDGGKKGKSMSYQFDTNTYVALDDQLFDFVPFAFYGNREAFFINDNVTIRRAVSVNRTLEEMVKADEESLNVRRTLFRSIQEVAGFIDFDVEVILKNRERDYFETMFIRKESIKIIKELKVYKPFCFSIKINDNYYINVLNKLMECILNLIRTDELIELFLKANMNHYVVTQLIQVNSLICGGGEEMKKSMQMAYACAKLVAKKIPENKLASYRHKMTSAIVFKDYDRVCQILLSLSNYADVAFEFTYSLYEDFEANKDIAYTFINALSKKEETNQNKKEDTV